jgi:Tfp pilus assembly protein PilN
MIKINLIPPEYVDKLNKRAVIAKAVVAGVATVSIIVVLSLWHVAKEKTIELKMTRLQAELKSLQTDVDRGKAIEAQIAEVQRYLDSINGIAKGRLIYTRFMQELAANLPGTIWFGGINTTVSGPTLSVAFTVNSRSTYDLAYWINALETDATCSDVVVGGINIAEVDSAKVLSTTINLKYTYK